MMEIVNYLKARYMNEKAQGLTEYAILLAFVVVVAAAVTTSAESGLSGAITAAFNKVSTTISDMK